MLAPSKVQEISRARVHARVEAHDMVDTSPRREETAQVARKYLCDHFIEPAGYAQAAGTELRFAFQTSGGLAVFRGNPLLSRACLLARCSDTDVWSYAFPGRRNRLFDVAAAAAFLIGRCIARGKMELPPEVALRPVGRPPKARVT